MNAQAVTRIEKRLFTPISIIMLVLSIGATVWNFYGMACPPPYVPLLMLLMSLSFVITCLDSLYRLPSQIRLFFGLTTSALVVFLICWIIASELNWAQADLIISEPAAIILAYYNLRINQWWRNKQ